MDRNDIINNIIDLLGDGGSRELAEQVYDNLRADDRIYADDQGLHISDGVDLIQEAADAMRLESAAE